jgi:hypothetical protein
LELGYYPNRKRKDCRASLRYARNDRRQLSDVSFAGCHALAAGLGALLAVVVLVMAALVGALLADFNTLFDNVFGVGRIAGDEGGGEATDVGAVAVGANACGHHFGVSLVEASVGAILAGGHAAGQGVEERAVFLGRVFHKKNR